MGKGHSNGYGYVDFILYPVCPNSNGYLSSNNHWLVYVIHIETARFTVLDSLNFPQNCYSHFALGSISGPH